MLVIFVRIIIFLFLVDQIYEIIRLLERIAVTANVNMIYVETILKIIGIAYIAEFGSQITKDAGKVQLLRKLKWQGKF